MLSGLKPVISVMERGDRRDLPQEQPLALAEAILLRLSQCAWGAKAAKQAANHPSRVTHLYCQGTMGSRFHEDIQFQRRQSWRTKNCAKYQCRIFGERYFCNSQAQPQEAQNAPVEAEESTARFAQVIRQLSSAGSGRLPGASPVLRPSNEAAPRVPLFEAQTLPESCQSVSHPPRKRPSG